MKQVVFNVPEERADDIIKKLEAVFGQKVVKDEDYVPEAGSFVAFGDDTCEENPFVGIFKEWYNGTDDKIICYAHVNGEGVLQDEEEYWNADVVLRPATDEETERLIKALAKSGRRWNGEELEFEDCATYEAIRTFDDACSDLNVRAQAGDELANVLMTDLQFNSPRTPDLEAFIKLRIITYAINEGWEPKFVEGEYRWFPWFYLYTQAEIDAMSEEQRAKVLCVGGLAASGARCGLASSYSSDGFSLSRSAFGARLAFSDKARAEYAGKRFIELYAALNFRAVERKAE